MLEVTPLNALPQNRPAERPASEEVAKSAEREAQRTESVPEEPNQDKTPAVSSDAHAGHDGNKGGKLDVKG